MARAGHDGLTYGCTSSKAFVTIVTSGKVECAMEDISPDTLEPIVTGILLTVRSDLYRQCLLVRLDEDQIDMRPEFVCCLHTCFFTPKCHQFRVLARFVPDITHLLASRSKMFSSTSEAVAILATHPASCAS